MDKISSLQQLKVKLIQLGHLASVELFNYISDPCQGDGEGFPRVLYYCFIQPALYEAISSCV